MPTPPNSVTGTPSQLKLVFDHSKIMMISTSCKQSKLTSLLWMKLYKHICCYLPGPASTVEEHSLRNISSEGTVVRNSPRGIFSDASRIYIWRTPQSSDKSINSRNLDLGITVRDYLHCTKGNVAWINWSILLYYATLHNYSSNLRRYSTRY